MVRNKNGNEFFNQFICLNILNNDISTRTALVPEKL